jgi:hypothetical protein
MDGRGVIRHLPLEYQVRGSAERQVIARVLRLLRRHIGAGQAIRAAAVVEELGLTGGDPARDVQTIVKFLVEERYLPIGTLPRPPYGYFWIETNDERRAVRDHLVRRAISILIHARAFDTDSIVAPLLGQLELEFPEV